MRGLFLFVAAALGLAAGSASAQEAPDRPVLGSTLTAPILADLPSGSSVYSMLDAAIAEVIADRADTGGLYAGEAARVGSHGSSWTQTLFRVGDADITNPDRGGTPLLMPGVNLWERVEVTTGLLPVEVNSAGVAVTLVPRRPSAVWTRTVEATGAAAPLLAGQTVVGAPALATQHAWLDGHVLMSGPLQPGRLGIVFAGGFTASSRFERIDTTNTIDSNVASAFTHLVFTPNRSDEVRLLGWLEHSGTPYANRVAFAQPAASETSDAVHGQIAWDHKSPGGATWTLFGSGARRGHSNDLAPSAGIVVDRLTDGPVPELLNPRDGSDTTWGLGARVSSAPMRASGTANLLRGGVSLSGAGVTAGSGFTGRIGELVGGLPARVWDYTSPATASHWADTVLALYATDTITPHPRVSLEAGLRFEALRASADGSASSVSWNNWLPRGNLRYEIIDFARIAAIAGFARYGERLPLNDLAYGDPLSPSAQVFRWDTAPANPRLSDLGPLVARVGPGTGGNSGFVSIDPNLARPYTDEFVAGFESRPGDASIIRLVTVARREKQLLGVTNVGVPESMYIAGTITDTGDAGGESKLLPVYNRPPSTFGLDRYVLSNPPDDESTFVGVDLTLQADLKRLWLMAGATAGRSEGLAANVGYLPLENDPGVLGDVFIDPNSRTFAQGRVFTERGYTIKTAGVLRLPWDVKVGYAARYQDGQMFSRLVVVPGLNQGAEAIRTFRNGGWRFTYNATLDVRLQKSVTAGNQRVVFVLDAYNLLNMGLETEELTLAGPNSRVTTAVQPPRTIHLGLRIPF